MKQIVTLLRFVVKQDGKLINKICLFTFKILVLIFFPILYFVESLCFRH